MPETDDATMLNPMKEASMNQDFDEDINKLFLTDNTWQEPDWKTFEPYQAPDIEPPNPKDFGLETYSMQQDGSTQEAVPIPSDLPSFDEQGNAVEQVFERREKREVPFELYVTFTLSPRAS